MPTSKRPSATDRLAAIESLDDVIIAVDRDLRVTSWNAAAERLMDRPASEAIGLALMTMVTPGQRINVGHLLDRALSGDSVARQRVTLARRDGNEVVLSIAIAPIPAAGRPTGLILLGHDVAEQQRLQYQLLRSRQMESTGQLAGGVAHEFNNILTAILGLGEFALRALPAGTPARGDIEEIREQADKGVRLVRHLLAFSRRQLLRTEPTALGPVLQELEPLLHRLITERITIMSEVVPGTRAVNIDRAQIELVLLELVSNAADAMEGSGTIDIDVRSVALENHPVLPRGHYVQVKVRDSGSGVGAADREHVFEPFFTTKGPGHPGLGLAMVEGVISQHGGAIAIESTPGEGTTATVLLPSTGVAVPEAEPFVPDPVSTMGPTETILVVEDETTVRNVVVRSLRSRGYEVLEAKHGEDALLVAERHNAPIHLIVTDVVMPNMSGTELFQLLRGWYPRMRVLFISGYAKSAIPPEALEEGKGASFLAKPFTIEQLLNEVQRMILMPRKSEAGV
jgi:PAS domain S-box-containing protein